MKIFSILAGRLLTLTVGNYNNAAGPLLLTRDIVDGR